MCRSAAVSANGQNQAHPTNTETHAESAPPATQGSPQLRGEWAAALLGAGRAVHRRQTQHAAVQQQHQRARQRRWRTKDSARGDTFVAQSSSGRAGCVRTRCTADSAVCSAVFSGSCLQHALVQQTSDTHGPDTTQQLRKCPMSNYRAQAPRCQPMLDPHVRRSLQWL